MCTVAQFQVAKEEWDHGCPNCHALWPSRVQLSSLTTSEKDEWSHTRLCDLSDSITNPSIERIESGLQLQSLQGTRRTFLKFILEHVFYAAMSYGVEMAHDLGDRFSQSEITDVSKGACEFATHRALAEENQILGFSASDEARTSMKKRRREATVASAACAAATAAAAVVAAKAADVTAAVESDSDNSNNSSDNENSIQ